MRIILMLSICLMVIGCGEDATRSKETVFDAQIQTLEKAREVEGQMQRASERTRQVIEEAEARTE